MRAAAADRTQTSSAIYLICAAAWFLPGAGHLWLGWRQKGIVFLVTLTLMFTFGLWLEGRLFPFEVSQPLVALAAVADIGVGLPYLIAKAMGVGAGRVVAITYEYGNTFVIAAGLLNMLVVLDAFEAMVSEWPEVRECHMIRGGGDFLLRLVVRDTPHENALTARLTGAPHVSRVQTLQTIRTAKDAAGVPVEGG